MLGGAKPADPLGASSAHVALGAVGAMGAVGDAASAWRSQSLTQCSAPIVGPSFLPSLSLHPIRPWHRQQELWKHHTTLPLPWLFTEEINRERNSAEQMLGPMEQPWEARAPESSSETDAERSSLESLSKPQTNEDPQPSVRPARRS